MDDYENTGDELDAAPDNLPEADTPPPADDPYGLRTMRLEDLQYRPGDGVLSPVMRIMAERGHPGFQDWAAQDAANHGLQPPGVASDPTSLSMTPRGEAFLKAREGWHGFGRDSVEGGAQTVYWGHKLQPGEDPHKMDPDATLKADRTKAEGLVRAAAGSTPMTPQQFDAFTSFAYNSPGAFVKSPSNFFYELLNNGNVRGAANRMLLWNQASDGKGGKVVLPGLTDRRNRERSLAIDGDYGE